MSEITNFPRESTMKEIAESLRAIAFSKAGELTNISDWSQVSGFVRNGYSQKLFDYGDQFSEKWTDTADSKMYDYIWRVNHF